jgi:steroid delta-isomerase-like uncharacterized protein
MSEENKAVVRRFFEEGFNKGDGSVFDELVAEGTVDHDPQNRFRDVTGPEGAKKGMELYRSAFPDLRFTIEDQIAEGNMVATRFTGTGTQEGDLPDLPATHKRTTVGGVTIDRIENGKIVETWVYWDALGLMQQLGAVPTPAAAHA